MKKFLIYAYSAGCGFFFMSSLLGFGFFELGITIGLLNAIIVVPIVETFEKGNKAREIKQIFKYSFAKNVVISVFICYLIAYLRFVFSEKFFYVDLEAFSFAFIYATLNFLISFIFLKVRNLFFKGDVAK